MLRRRRRRILVSEGGKKMKMGDVKEERTVGGGRGCGLVVRCGDVKYN